MLVRFERKQDSDHQSVLGYDWFEVVMNLGPFPSGKAGDMLVVRNQDGVTLLCSNDIAHELPGYDITVVGSPGASSRGRRRKQPSKKR